MPTPEPPVSTPLPPVTTPPPAPPPTTADANATVTAEQLFSAPAARQCVSRRTVRVKVKPPRGVKVNTVTAKANGKKRPATAGAKATITLGGLPRGSVRVEVTATLSTGRKVTLKRTYRTCAR
jgi:hypothetical protein